MSSQKSGKLSGGLIQAPDASRVVDFLRGFHAGAKVGAEVEAATRGRVTAEQFRKWDELGARPSFMAFCALIDAYGPELLLALSGGRWEWLSGAVRDRKAASLDREIDALIARRRALGADPLSPLSESASPSPGGRA